jgi:hypothetical protein
MLEEMINEAYNYLSARNIIMLSEDFYILFKELVEDIEYKIKTLKCKKELKNPLLTKIVVIKLGAKIPLNYFDEDLEFYKFIKNNNLDLIFFVSKLTIKFDKQSGVMIPVETRRNCISWFVWNSLEWKWKDSLFSVYHKNELLFQTDESLTFTEDYCSLMCGITKYNIVESADFRPYKYQDPASYSYQNLLIVQITWKLDKRASYFHQTHASLELKDEHGLVRSVGQDIFDHVHASPKHRFSRSAKRSSIIKTPDLTSYYPKNHRMIKKFIFPISKKEHDRLITLVESDKFNHKETASLMKGNCVSYTCSLLKRGLDYNVYADVAGFEILTRNIFPAKVDNFIQKAVKKLQKIPSFLQKAFFFFPPVYLLGVILGYINFIASKTGYNDHREYSLNDYLFRPWIIRCDIPLILKDVLERHADENGVICREKYPPGSIID